MSEQERQVHLAFAILSIAEAEHAFYMLKDNLQRQKRGETFSAAEAAEYHGRAQDRMGALRVAFEAAEGKGDT